MTSSAMYAILANAVLIIHAAFVAFVVLIIPFIYIGKASNWRWTRIYWLRIAHLIGICIVAAQSWAGVICPLTTLEMWLRENSDLATYSGGFIEHWLQRLIYWDLPAWAFIALYSLFALLVIFTWYVVPPTKSRNRSVAPT